MIKSESLYNTIQKNQTLNTLNKSKKFYLGLSILGKITLFILIVSFSITLLENGSNHPAWIFLDGANLLIHEAGHIVFIPFGEFMALLGGSITQLLVPLIFFLSFLIKKQWFSSAFTIFWFSDSAINLSYYIGDARARNLPLFGLPGAKHDWYTILSQLNLLSYDIFFSNIVYFFGAILVIISLSWMIINIIFSILSMLKN